MKFYRSLYLLFFSVQIIAQTDQDKIYFDRLGKKCLENQAYYFREKTGKPDEYKSYFVNGGNLYFEGKIITPSDTTENLNVYSGTCTWYFKNGKKKAIRSFNAAGLEINTSTYYYENGKIWKEIDYFNGKIVDNLFTEYDEDGKVSKTFEENFNTNSNEWDLYTSDKTSAIITNGCLTLTSFTKEGAARYINMLSGSQDFILDATIGISKLNNGDKTGMIYGFKDWQNYNFFLISNTSFYIGSVYEGVLMLKANGMYSSDIKKTEANVIKVIGIGEKNIYTINGAIQYTSDKIKNPGSNFGFSVSGKNTVTIENFVFKQINYKNSNTITSNNNDLNVKATGSGIFISTNGYIITNYHVIDNANRIRIEVNENGSPKSYDAVVIQKDIDNDLAIIKVQDDNFKPLLSIDYSFIESGAADVGASVFTIGFPYALSGMGKDAKFTDGKISAKTGYNGAINSYQTSVPIQPGNSGGPLFNDKGQLIGIMNSIIQSADNVSYAIKINYIKNLVELLPDGPPFPNSKKLFTSSTEERVKVITQYVVLIKIL